MTYRKLAVLSVKWVVLSAARIFVLSVEVSRALNSVRLHGGELIAGGVSEVKASATRKAEGCFCDNSSPSLDERFSRLERFDLNNRQGSARGLFGVGLKPEVYVPGHRARIGRTKVTHREAECVRVERLCGAGGSDWKFDETDSISHGVPFVVFPPRGPFCHGSQVSVDGVARERR
jgi:hypothetical protein